MKATHKKVLDFYQNSSPKQKAYLIELIKDQLIFFDAKRKNLYECDKDYLISLNGVKIQINIK